MDLYPNADYFCITRLKFFISERFTLISWDDLLMRMADHFGFNEIPYGWHDPMTFSDWARFYYLAYNPDTLYLDTDCKMTEKYFFETERKFIHSPGNICLLYSPNQTAMHPLEMIRERTNVGLLIDLAFKMDRKWSKPISSQYFKHK